MAAILEPELDAEPAAADRSQHHLLVVAAQVDDRRTAEAGQVRKRRDNRGAAGAAIDVVARDARQPPARGPGRQIGLDPRVQGSQAVGAAVHVSDRIDALSGAAGWRGQR